MPVELLAFPPAYVVGASSPSPRRHLPEVAPPLSLCTADRRHCTHTVGAYRLLTDSSLYLPIWRRSGKALQRALLLALPLALVSLPLTRIYVQFILARSPFSPSDIHNANFLGVSPVQYTTWMLVLGQASMFLEWMLKRELRKSRDEVYEATVRSRGKGAPVSLSPLPHLEATRRADLLPRSLAAADFWQPYTEEWREPPIERAKRAGEKQSFYMRLSSPLMRIVLLRGASSLLFSSSSLAHWLNSSSCPLAVLLTPLSFIPGLSLAVMSAIRSLTLGRSLHRTVRPPSSFRHTRRMLTSPVPLAVLFGQEDDVRLAALPSPYALTPLACRSPLQVELFVTEREIGYRSASRLPLVLLSTT